MPLKDMLLQFGMGTDIQGDDYTKAAVRAVQDALRHNSIALADAFGQTRNDMVVKILIGVAKPDQVDRATIAAILPYGKAEVEVVEGGMDTPREGAPGATILANAALTVCLDLDDATINGTAA